MDSEDRELRSLEEDRLAAVKLASEPFVFAAKSCPGLPDDTVIKVSLGEVRSLARAVRAAQQGA